MKIFKPQFWQKKNSLVSFLLLPLSLLLQLIIFLRCSFFNKTKFPIPIICVGNIYLGGTGKTPLSIEIVKILEKLGKKTAIVKKSYRNHEDEFELIKSKQVVLFKKSSRALAINSSIKDKYDCVVLDDGFQDPSIITNLNIVCFNAKQLIGNGMTIPSGPLRETLNSLKRCQIIMINGNKNLEFENKIKKKFNNISIYYSKYTPININKFVKKNLLAFAGIGNPENFFKLLEENKLNVIKKISFPDHYKYSLHELNELINFSLKNNLKIVTTEKDFFRIKNFQLPQIESLNIKLNISNKEKFEKELTEYL